MNLKFETEYKTILEKVDQIDPLKYGLTRNYIDGAVTYLSPYISRGVISTKLVLESVLGKGYKIYQIEAFIKELCWRDYFQRVAQVKNIDVAIKQEQSSILNKEIPSRIINATTEIEVIDVAIRQLYETGYMHNHCRMYTASLVCNVAQSHWLHPAQWMYYHLIDGDWASNACSWQWVAGANSNKKYYANQENINKYCYTNQRDTFLDKTYEILEKMDPPRELIDIEIFPLLLELPVTSVTFINPELPTFIYNYYNLDPLWANNESGNRILLIEPDFFKKYPVSKKCIDFMLELSQNIKDIQIYTGSFQSFIERYKADNIYFKEHPLNIGYVGNQVGRDWITEEVIGYYPSFFAYWKQVSKKLNSKYSDNY